MGRKKLSGGACATATMLLVVASVTAAQAIAAPIVADVPALVQKAADGGGAQVIKVFDAGSGLKGYVVEGKTPFDVTIYYSTADGNRIFGGPLLQADGKTVTQQHLADYGPKPDYVALYNNLIASEHVLVTGTQATTLRVFYEPHDPYSQKLYQSTLGIPQQVRWVPVAFLAEDSAQVVTGMLKSGANAYEPMAMAQSEEGRQSLIKRAPGPEASKKTALENWKLAESFGLKGTPLLVWKRKDGSIGIQRGLPSVERLKEILRESSTS